MLTLPVGVKTVRTNQLQVQLKSPSAFHPQRWGVQFEKPAILWEKKHGRVPPLPPMTGRGRAQRSSVPVALGLLLGLQGLPDIEATLEILALGQVGLVMEADTRGVVKEVECSGAVLHVHFDLLPKHT